MAYIMTSLGLVSDKNFGEYCLFLSTVQTHMEAKQSMQSCALIDIKKLQIK